MSHGVECGTPSRYFARRSVRVTPEMAASPYGEAGEIFVGATTADFFQNIVLMLDDVLTRDQRAEMETVYGIVDGQPDMSPFADLLVVHELAHLFHVQVRSISPGCG